MHALQAPDVFLQVTLASALGSLLLFGAFVLWAYRAGLLLL